jgi:hypothetical protein
MMQELIFLDQKIDRCQSNGKVGDTRTHEAQSFNSEKSTLAILILILFTFRFHSDRGQDRSSGQVCV